MLNELMVRLFGGASLALLLLAGLSTSARALADPPDGNAECAAVYSCTSSYCPVGPPCGVNHCKDLSGTRDCSCFCADYTAGEDQCGCSLGNAG